MTIDSKAIEELKGRMHSEREVFCRSLFFSAKWFVLSDCAKSGLHFIVLPNQETAEYCAADLYNLIEGDRVFFLPNSGNGVEKSNFKSTLSVQRTTAVQSIVEHKEGDLTIIVTFPEALDEPIPVKKKKK